MADNFDWTQVLGPPDQASRGLQKYIEEVFRNVQVSPSASPMQTMMMKPSGGQQQKAAKAFGKNTKQAMGGVSKSMGMFKREMISFGKEMDSPFKAMNKAIDATKSKLDKLTAAFSKLGKGIKGSEFGKFSGRAGRPIARAGGWAARKGVQGAAFLGQGLLGFMTGAYRQGIQNYEQMSMARLGGAPYMTGMAGSPQAGAKDWRKRYGYQAGRYESGGRMGYNLTQAAQIQSQAARMGIAGQGAGNQAFMLSRAMGPEGTQWGASFMRRRGLGGASGAKMMMKELSSAMVVGIRTGLKEERIGEFLQAANQYAEEQIKITPDKDQFDNFKKELGLIQMRGGAGMAGRYGAGALGRADQAVKSAQGTQQSFLMRAFGFGRGASFLETLRRQEAGAVGKGPGGESNMMAIMKHLRREYGAGQHGGLSEQALLAFKGMGFGSTSMAQKFGDIYLKRQKGEITAKDARKQITKIEESEKAQRLPAIQRKAYAAMSAFGGVAQTLAKQFSQLAGFAAKNYKLKQWIIDLQKGLIEGVKPLMKSIHPLFKKITSLLPVLMKPIALGLTKLVELMTKMVTYAEVMLGGKIKASGGHLVTPGMKAEKREMMSNQGALGKYSRLMEQNDKMRNQAVQQFVKKGLLIKGPGGYELGASTGRKSGAALLEEQKAQVLLDVIFRLQDHRGPATRRRGSGTAKVGGKSGNVRVRK